MEDYKGFLRCLKENSLEKVPFAENLGMKGRT
jgi:hypothetical protein